MFDLRYLLQRYSDNKESTLGILLRLAERPLFQCYTLEDEYRAEKLAGETRIPAGVYELKLRQVLSPMTQKYRARRDCAGWFTWHIEVVGVPGFVAVYIHIGNKDDDTDGCILLGDLPNNNTLGDGAVNVSVAAFKRWYIVTASHLSAGGRAYLEVRDELALGKAA